MNEGEHKFGTVGNLPSRPDETMRVHADVFDWLANLAHFLNFHSAITASGQARRLISVCENVTVIPAFLIGLLPGLLPIGLANLPRP